MAFITILSRDPAVRALPRLVADTDSVATTRSWGRLLWLIRERPVTVVVVDSGALPSELGADVLFADLRRRFPSVGTVLVARPGLSPVTLLQLGRAGIAGLVLVPVDDVERDLARNVARAGAHGTSSLVQRAIGPRLAVPTRAVVRAALDAALLGWSSDELARHAGWTRAHLSVRLREDGLPPVGKLLLWAKLVHAARWLPEPGRTAESVSRQLEYANGATFRRALRNYLGVTPTELVARGAFGVVLARFLDVCGLDDSLGAVRIVA